MAGEPEFVCHPIKGPLLFVMSPDLLLKYEITLTNAGLFRVNGGPPMAGDELKTLLFAESDTNNLTDTLLTKLNGIETAATADQTDSEIETAYNNQVSVVSQGEAEAGTSTTIRRWTSERIAQAIAALESGEAVDSVAGKTGVVTLDMDDLSETASGKILTASERTSISTAEQSANKGSNNGYAPLDGSAIVPLANLPASVKTGSEYKGEYNASSNSPTLIDGTGSNGDYYRVAVAGTQDFGAGNITFSIGDIVVYNGTTTLWQRISGNPDLVTSVAGKQGVVALDMDDLSETASAKIFSDTERTKLTGIETGATTDQSDSEIETAYNNQVSVVSQVEAETGTNATVRRWTAERVAQAIAALAPGGGGSLNNNYLYAYDTITQTANTADTFEALTFSNNGVIDGWTHTVNTNVFGCNQAGVYECTISSITEKSSGGATQNIGVRALFNGSEIAGSFNSIIHANTSDFRELTTTFMFTGVSGQALTIEFAGSSTSMSVLPGPTGASPTVNASVKITVKRIT